MNYGVLLVFGVVLATIVFSFITAKGGLTDNRRKWYNRLTPRGWVGGFLGVVIIAFSIGQYFYQTKQSKGFAIAE